MYLNRQLHALLHLVENFKMATSAILNYYLVILDHPRSLFVDRKWYIKFGVDRAFTFQDTVI